jgi:NTE family protein
MLFMFLDKSDPDQIPASGVYIQPNLKGYTTLDFAKARSLIDSGYVQTIRQINEIKNKVATRISCDEVTEKRNNFSNNNYPLLFDEIKFYQFNSRQRTYLKRLFNISSKKKSDISFSEMKNNYFKLVSERYFSNTYPTISFNQQRKKFALELTRRQQKNFQVDFGGVIATRDISNIFMGLNYYHFSRKLIHGYASFQSGNFYRSVVTQARIDYPSAGGFFIEPQFISNSWDFLESADLLREVQTTILRRIDRQYSVKVGWPINQAYKMYLHVGGLSNKDSYSNNSSFTSTNTLDELKLDGLKTGISISSNSLNRKQYASAGRSFSFTANYFDVDEDYRPGNTSVRTTSYNASHKWISATLKAEQYVNKGWFRPGYLIEAAYSSQPFFANYKGSLIYAPAFNPLPESPSLLLERFRARSYVAGGGRFVITLAPKLDWRLEGYAFKPLEALQELPDQQTGITTKLLDVSLSGMTGIIFHSPIGPISLMANYYDDEENEFGVLMHVGFLLFNKSSMH